jgi:hypothetical protein
MSKRTHLLSFIAVMCAFGLLSGCGDRSPRWGGRIEERNGLVVVQIPARPIHPHAALILKEDLSIGREGAGEEYLFSDISGLDADSEGRIYVINRPDANVRVFDRSGLFLRTIGEKARDPGDGDARLCQVDAADIFIFDYLGHRGLYFSPDGAI